MSNDDPLKHRPWLPSVLGIVVLATIAGCGTVDDTGTASRCVAVPTDLVASIADGLTVDGGGSLRNAAAVRTTDRSAVWIIAADIQGPGMEGTDEVGVWALSGEDLAVGGGLLIAVDGLAREFSEWGAALPDDSELRVKSTEDGVREARECAEAGGV